VTDPHLAVNSEYPNYIEAVDLETNTADTSIFTKAADGETNFLGMCWPGTGVWLDPFNKAARKWWGSLYTNQRFKGITDRYQFWVDMNEPAVFASEMRTMQLNNVHKDDNMNWILHRDVHNAYGSMVQKAIYEGLLERHDHKKRPFILTRSYFLGQQRWGTYWTGDNWNNFNEMSGAVNNILTNGLTGVINGGSDIPGFLDWGRKGANDKYWDWLVSNFYQLGVFMPFMRAHGDELGGHMREPWLFKPHVQEVIRQTVWQRYSFIHYLYTTFYFGSKTGIPIMRPMFLEFPKDFFTFTLSSQFMFGDSFLFAMKNTPNVVDGNGQSTSYQQVYAWDKSYQKVEAYLPHGEKGDLLWYDYSSKLPQVNENGDSVQFVSRMQKLDESLLLIKGGTIVPLLLHNEALSLMRCINNPIHLEAFLDRQGKAEGSLILDDGISIDSNTSKYRFRFENNRLVIIVD